MSRLFNIVIVVLCNVFNIKVFSMEVSVPQLSKFSLTDVKANREDDTGVHSNTLDIHLAMEFDTNPTNLRSMIRDEIKSILKDLKNSNSEVPEEDSSMKNIVATNLNNISAKLQIIEGILKDIQTKSKTSSSSVDQESLCLREGNSLGIRGTHLNNPLKNKNDYPKNCKDALQKGNNLTGVYEIFPEHSEAPFSVLCDMEVKGGGWTHIQKRFDGSQDFFLDWRNYKFGFGNIHGEFWLGLQKIFLLSGFEPTELLVEIVDRDNISASAHYTSFAIGSEPGGYKLDRLSGFSGDAGDSLIQHLGAKFSTKDLDFSNACATKYFGAWWYINCHASNLNGKYINIELPEKLNYAGLHWTTFRGVEYSHAKVRMLVRPHK